MSSGSKDAQLESGFHVPILLLGFNRPEECLQVISALREIGAKKIYFSVDGPRLNSDSDSLKVEMVRQLQSQFDWGCELKTRFLDENLGCKLAISSGISWFFENVDEGIILEDDCVPNMDFFIFCERMLEKYRSSDKVMHISGTSYLPSSKDHSSNHYFSTLHDVWGWATWKSAWDYFTINIKYPDKESEDKILINYFGSKKVAKWFHRYLEDSKSPNCTLWSTYWSYALITKNALSVAPVVNLVQNIGFREGASHGSDDSFKLYNTFPMKSLPDFPDPLEIEISRNLDSARFRLIKKTDPALRTLGILRARSARIPGKIFRSCSLSEHRKRRVYRLPKFTGKNNEC